ncbi:MAG: hypothetical protein R2793_02495 [Flavobacteriaceae bacterium]
MASTVLNSAPVYFGFGKVGKAVFLEVFVVFLEEKVAQLSPKNGYIIITSSIYLLFPSGSKDPFQFAIGFGFILGFIIPAFKNKLNENPLRPFVANRVTGTHFAAPVKTKAHFIELIFGNSFITLSR